MKMRRLNALWLAAAVLATYPAWAQSNSAAAGAAGNSNSADSDRMLTPPPVSGQFFPVQVGDQERSNYLRAGLAFTTAYTDNALMGLETHPVSDVSYSIAPNIALDETTTRMHMKLSYAPGFTFYQHTSALNEADQNAALEFEYRLSPHVTFSAQDGFRKTSNVFNQADLANAGAVSGGISTPNFSIFTPIADQLSNVGNVGIVDQFGRNSMLGASGTFSTLYFPNQAEVPGLYDASSQAGLGFYSHRITRGQYIGATYQYQRLVSYPTGGVNNTQTHAALAFYTIQPSARFSLSFFGGPQYSDTVSAAIFHAAPARGWTPAGGASFSWQSPKSSFALSYVHIVSSGGGLVEAVTMDSAMATVRRQFTRMLSAGVSGMYAQNDMVGPAILGFTNGHSISATTYLQRQFGQNMTAQMGYTRLHQDYGNIAALAFFPDTNREYISVNYQFSRPLGR